MVNLSESVPDILKVSIEPASASVAVTVPTLVVFSATLKTVAEVSTGVSSFRSKMVIEIV